MAGPGAAQAAAEAVRGAGEGEEPEAQGSGALVSAGLPRLGPQGGVGPSPRPSDRGWPAAAATAAAACCWFTHLPAVLLTDASLSNNPQLAAAIDNRAGEVGLAILDAEHGELLLSQHVETARTFARTL